MSQLEIYREESKNEQIKNFLSLKNLHESLLSLLPFEARAINSYIMPVV